MSNHFDIAVVGSGAAGIAASVAASRAGARVVMLDTNPAVGGTGGNSGLTTLCGLYDHTGNFLNGGLTQEFAEALAETKPILTGRVWVLAYRPVRFREVATRLLQPVNQRWNTAVAEVIGAGNRLTSLNGLTVGAVIDCSGTAEGARLCGAECLETDETTQAPALVFQLRNVTCDVTTTAAVARILMPLARAGLPLLSFHSNLEPKTVTVKLNSQPGQVLAIIDFLRTKVAGFETCEASPAEFKISRRAGRMIIGKHILSGEDVLAARKFPDAIARASWPIEQWDAGGVARFRYPPAGECYEIPARSLQSARFSNLFMAGKTISADVDAIASARVMGCCLATGEAAGRLAASWVSSNP